MGQLEIVANVCLKMMKICALAVVLAYFCQISGAYVFTEKPNQVIWGIEGDPLELNCAVDESWQVFSVFFG